MTFVHRGVRSSGQARGIKRPTPDTKTTQAALRDHVAFCLEDLDIPVWVRARAPTTLELANANDQVGVFDMATVISIRTSEPNAVGTLERIEKTMHVIGVNKDLGADGRLTLLACVRPSGIGDDPDGGQTFTLSIRH